MSSLPADKHVFIWPRWGGDGYVGAVQGTHDAGNIPHRQKFFGGFCQTGPVAKIFVLVVLAQRGPGLQIISSKWFACKNVAFMVIISMIFVPTVSIENKPVLVSMIVMLEKRNALDFNEVAFFTVDAI